MAYNFKNLADVELLNAMPEEANVLVEVNGATKRAPQVKVESGGIPRLFVLSEPIEEEPYLKMTPSLSYEELKALLESDNPPVLVIKEISVEEGVQYSGFSVQNCYYSIEEGIIGVSGNLIMRYKPDGTFEPTPK